MKKIITYTWQCEECMKDNFFDAPAAPYICDKRTCSHCGYEQEIEGVVDGRLHQKRARRTPLVHLAHVRISPLLLRHQNPLFYLCCSCPNRLQPFSRMLG